MVCSVRRHLLCPLFATRSVSAFFFRAQRNAAAQRNGGLKGGGAVYAVSARRPAAGPCLPRRFCRALRQAVERRWLRASAADGAAVCQEVQYLNMCQPLYRGSNIFRGHSTTVMEGEDCGGGDAWCHMPESGNERQIK